MLYIFSWWFCSSFTSGDCLFSLAVCVMFHFYRNLGIELLFELMKTRKKRVVCESSELESTHTLLRDQNICLQTINITLKFFFWVSSTLFGCPNFAEKRAHINAIELLQSLFLFKFDFARLPIKQIPHIPLPLFMALWLASRSDSEMIIKIWFDTQICVGAYASSGIFSPIIISSVVPVIYRCVRYSSNAPLIF